MLFPTILSHIVVIKWGKALIPKQIQKNSVLFVLVHVPGTLKRNVLKIIFLDAQKLSQIFSSMKIKIKIGTKKIATFKKIHNNLKDPRRKKAFDDKEARKENILRLTKAIKDCADPEEKKKLKSELEQIHKDRFKRLYEASRRSPFSQ